ncbi:putative magnesium transporter NIPA5 [Vitis vinifera]|uniref:Probable magnesium transporter n=1 Tax=Vitis vinifera TaxID=29760 RepID=A0A438KFK5_VITVI|nr:putative magnesium transporter NIPA5 [Vitis vinifera]
MRLVDSFVCKLLLGYHKWQDPLLERATQSMCKIRKKMLNAPFLFDVERALDTFNTAVVSPIYYVMFTSLTILASVIMFKDWDGQSGGSIISEICGFIVVLSGTILLNVTKDYEDSSFRGIYHPPLSSSLSARLCSGNGELLKHDEENLVSSDEICLRRQELY